MRDSDNIDFYDPESGILMRTTHGWPGPAEAVLDKDGNWIVRKAPSPDSSHRQEPYEAEPST